MINEDLMFKNFSALPSILFYKSLARTVTKEWIEWGTEYKRNKNFLCDITGKRYKIRYLENHECYTIDTINKKIIIDKVLTLFYPLHQMHHIGYLTTVKKSNLEFIHDCINDYLKTNIDFYNIDKELLHKLYVNYNDVNIIVRDTKEEILNEPIIRKMVQDDIYRYDLIQLNDYKYDISNLPNNEILKKALEKKNLLY